MPTTRSTAQWQRSRIVRGGESLQLGFGLQLTGKECFGAEGSSGDKRHTNRGALGIDIGGDGAAPEFRQGFVGRAASVTLHSVEMSRQPPGTNILLPPPVPPAPRVPAIAT